MSRLSSRLLLVPVAMMACALGLVGGDRSRSDAADARIAGDLTIEVVATLIPRPSQLALDASGRLVVLSHGWRGDAAAEIFWLDVSGPLPVDASRAPRLVVPFSDEPRKTVFGSLALDPTSGDIFLGEENGNRIYRLGEAKQLTLFAVGLQHLVGGAGIAVDPDGRLVVLDYVSPETQRRSEVPLPPTLEWLAGEGYQGPIVLRIHTREAGPLPRRLDLMAPLFPRAWTQRRGEEPLPRFVSVAVLPAGGLVLLDSLGEIRRLTSAGILQRFARLPSGHYHRTNMAVALDGSVFVSSGFHIRDLLRIGPTGAVTRVARELGDPAGIVVDRSGAVYLAETALHRIIRIR